MLNDTTRGIEVLNQLPKGWKINKAATTNPTGYVWINNNKSIFDKEYKHALLKEKRN